MKKKKYIYGSVIIIASFVIILLFNTFLYPLFLAGKGSKNETIQFEATNQPMLTISSTRQRTEKTASQNNDKIKWIPLPKLEDISAVMVQRVSEYEERGIDPRSLDAKVKETLLSKEVVMDILRERVSNLKETNQYAYVLQLIESDVPGVPYKYNVIIGNPKSIIKSYMQSEPFADYNEVAKIVVPIKGNIYLDQLNYLQINAITGGILIHIAQSNLADS